MNTLERAARALCEFRGADPDALEPGNDPYHNNTEVIDGYNRKDEPCHFFWRHYEDQARAVIKAIREPDENALRAAASTPGMEAANLAMMMHSARGYTYSEHAFEGGAPLLQAWTAMIDTILQEDE